MTLDSEWMAEARRHHLTPVDLPNPYGLEIVEQTSMVQIPWLTALKNRIKFMFRPFLGAQEWLKRGKTYKSLFLSNMFNEEHVLMLDLLNKSKAEAVTEIACGWGKNLKLIFDHVPSVKRAVGIDISTDMLNECKTLLKGKDVSYLTAPFNAIPTEALTDWVIIFNSLLYCNPREIPVLFEALSKRARNVLVLREPTSRCGNYSVASNISFFHNYLRVLKAYKPEVLKLKNDFITFLIRF